MAMKPSSQCVYVLMMVLGFVMVGYVKSTDAKEREECTNQLIGLSTCLPYVGGTSKAPTPDCCNGLKQVLTKSKKCLCLLVQDRNDPTLGLKVNATLAMNLPSICKSEVSIADCPDLLHLPPNSPEAKVFQQYEKSLHDKTSPTSAANSTTGTKAQGKMDAGSGNRSLGLKTVTQISLWCFIAFVIASV